MGDSPPRACTPTGREHWLEDTGSANGTSLNGEQLLRGQWRPLRSGDLVRVGGAT
jgi:pSer/pThr/pTyr-binding forkhead associated (FHA) protein